MMITKNNVVAVNYSLTASDVENGPETIVEETTSDNPFVFIHGNGDLLPDFELNLNAKKVGDTFDFRINAENGYGLVHPDHVVNVPIEAFKDDEGNIDTEMVVVGNVLPMHDHEGNRLQGTVTEITDTYIKMDFNHPLAGKHLHFKGTVLSVREATAEELNHGHVHGEGGHHH